MRYAKWPHYPHGHITHLSPNYEYFVFIKHFLVGFMVFEIPRVSVFGHCRIRLLSPRIVNINIYLLYL